MDSKDDKKRAFEVVERALSEFEAHGRVVSVECENCHGLLEVKRLSDTALSVKCTCGKYNDVLRGL